MLSCGKRSDKKKLLELIRPLLKQLGITRPSHEILVMSILDIYHGRKSGWLNIDLYCCFKQKKNALIIFKCILNAINWKSEKEALEDKKNNDNENGYFFIYI